MGLELTLKKKVLVIDEPLKIKTKAKITNSSEVEGLGDKTEDISETARQKRFQKGEKIIFEKETRDWSIRSNIQFIEIIKIK